MPIGWTIISGTPPELEGLWDDPAHFRQVLDQLVIDAGAGLDDVYFEDGEHTAYAVVHFAGTEDDAVTALANIKQKFGADNVTYLLNVEERLRRQRGA